MAEDVLSAGARTRPESSKQKVEHHLKNETTMEEKNNMTAERSLEIITEQIERSRQMVAKDTGLSLYVAGLCTMGMAILIGIIIFFTTNTAWYLMYILLPITIFAADRYAKRGKPKVPASLVSSMVDKTWQAFGIFAFAYLVFGILYNMLMSHFEQPEVYMRMMIQPLRVVLLLMGITITINGYILKSRWMVWCGIVGGVVLRLRDTDRVVGSLYPC